MTVQTRLLIDVLNRSFAGRGWHGPTLTGALRGVDPEAALWRPEPGRHCIWDLALHAAYWKYAVTCRLTGLRPAGGFARSPSNWPAPPTEPTDRAWRADQRLLRSAHTDLCNVVRTLTTRRLQARSPRGPWRVVEMVYGVAAHDAYHTGQIQYIKRLAVGR